MYSRSMATICTKFVYLKALMKVIMDQSNVKVQIVQDTQCTNLDTQYGHTILEMDLVLDTGKQCFTQQCY